MVAWDHNKCLFGSNINKGFQIKQGNSEELGRVARIEIYSFMAWLKGTANNTKFYKQEYTADIIYALRIRNSS
jgi:hypothetical protein